MFFVKRQLVLGCLILLCGFMVGCAKPAEEETASSSASESTSAVEEGTQAVAEPDAGKAKMVQVHLDKGVTLTKSAKWEEAISELNKAVQLDPYHVTAHATLGWAYSETGEWESAITHLRTRAMGSFFASG